MKKMRRKRRKNPKVIEAFRWVSKAVRLEEAIEYCKRYNVDMTRYVRVEDIPAECCCCKKVKAWIKMDCGHYLDRGSGGLSGVYFNRANLHIQCKSCNGGLYVGTRRPDVKKMYDAYMLARYGRETIDDLNVQDKINSYRGMIVAIGMEAKCRYETLKRSVGK